MKHCSVGRCGVIVFCQKVFSAIFCLKRLNFLYFCERASKFPNTDCVVFLSRSFSSNVLAESNFFFHSCVDNVVINRSEIFGGQKLFAGEFLATTIKNPIFSEGKYYFVALFSPSISYVASNCCLSKGSLWIIGFVQFLAERFVIFPHIFGRKFP